MWFVTFLAAFILLKLVGFFNFDALVILSIFLCFRFQNDNGGTDKLTHTRGLVLQNSCGDTIIKDRWLHFERNLMQKEAEYSHF